jgi:hypothetical protein
MDFEQIIRIPEPVMKVKAEVREVVHDVNNKPHVFIRVRLSGWHFPQRAPEPFMVIGRVVSKFVLIGPGEAYADGYFDVRPPRARQVSFGYGNTISWDFAVAVDPPKVPALDKKRLPKGVIQLRALSSSEKKRE